MSKLLPPWADFLLLALLVAGIGLAVHGYGQARFKAGQELVQGRWDAQTVRQQRAAIQAQAAAAAETQRRLGAQKEIINATSAQLDRAQADADAAGRAGQRLRADLAAYIATHRGGATSSAAAASAGASTGDALDVLAQLFSGADDTAGELAQAADRARVAGLACERSYDALTP
jgi:hypothetical protein